MAVLGNFVAFQVGWFACVLGGAYGFVLGGTLVGAVIVLCHLGRATRPMSELVLLAVAGLIGTLWDSALVGAGWIAYPTGTVIEGAAPYWITMLWLLFATTFNVSLRWLRGRWFIAAMLGAVAAPLAYYAGHRLGALSLRELPEALVAQAVGYAVLVPVLLSIAQGKDGFAATQRVTASAPAADSNNAHV